MEFKQTVLQRRMVRNFSSNPVPIETVEGILDLARRGPSAGYTQGQDFVIVTDKARKNAIAANCGERFYVEKGFAPFISSAPVLIVPCTNEAAYHRRYQEPDKTTIEGDEIDWPVPYWFMDVGCAVMTILLGVVDAGLAAGFAGSHDLEGLRAIMNIPAEITPVGVIPIGHPAPDKRSPSLRRGRRDFSDSIHHETW